MKKETTNHSFETFNPNFTTQSKPQSEFVYVSTSIPSAIVMISTQYQELPDKQKLELLSKLSEWTYNKTSEIINQNKKTVKKQYVLIDRLKMVAIEEVAVGKAINNKERPLSEASIEAEAVLQVLNYLYEIDEWKPEYIVGIELIQNAKSGSTE